MVYFSIVFCNKKVYRDAVKNTGALSCIVYLM